MKLNSQFKMKKTEFLSISIDPDSELKEVCEKYTDEQLLDFLFQFVKSCKKVNKEKRIQIIGFTYFDDVIEQ
jgi:hypothetical protein